VLLARHPGRVDPATRERADVVEADLGGRHGHATGATVLHLRCGMFFTNLLWEVDSIRDGVLRASMPLDYALPWADPRDTGEIAAVRLLCGGWPGRQGKQVESIAGMSAVNCEDFAAEDERSILTTTPATLAAWAYAGLRPALTSAFG
jgi:hypothetical protein